ncbi:hypothetical protein ARMSODRAFT_952604 [Armillaria solidipes]|uniref:Uncharacterized protein n=1 Tax=Armillaria solidipes TaxID=1076256 RepID=A0A2H3C2S0_9AGAR|nr:hypothetical protein ARMSODRAFT_952604 [Armillaria solidipes]
MRPLRDRGNCLSTLYQHLQELDVIQLAIHRRQIRFVTDDSCQHLTPSMILFDDAMQAPGTTSVPLLAGYLSDICSPEPK